MSIEREMASQIGVMLGKLAAEKRKKDPEMNRRVLEAGALGRKKIPLKKRREIASIAGSSVTKRVAHERALKGWVTRRKNACKY